MSRSKATSTQLGHLVEFMKMNPDVASGRGNGLQRKVALEQQWKNLTEILNALGGPVKSVEKWKQTWRDLRNGVKKKALKNKREQKGDGPGVANKESFDSKILDIEREKLAIQNKFNEKLLSIEEAKVATFERIATALENLVQLNTSH